MKKRLLTLLIVMIMAVLAMSACDVFFEQLPPNEYTVTFETNGASHINPVIVKRHGLVTRPEDPQRGYDIFDGWYSDAEFTQPWDFEKDKVTSVLTLYAKWIDHVHTGGEATCTNKPVCDVCNEEYGNAKGHVVITDAAVAPTCTTTGLTEGAHCDVCGEVIKAQEIIPITHAPETIPAVDATCSSTGLTEGSKCSVCGEILKAQEVVPALGHTEVVDKAVAPTCTETGLTEGKHCSVCNEVLVAQETVESLGHTVSDWNVVDPAAEADDRLFEGYCETCGELQEIDLYERFTELTYVTFGDSITYGIDGVDWGLMEDPYPDLVSRALNFKAFNNQAVSGATFCENTLNRTNMTKKILSFTGEADIISLMLGVNDCYVGLPLGTPESRDNTTIYGSLFLISEYLTTNYEDAFIFYMTPFPYRTCYSNNSAGYKLEDVANAIKYVAAHYDIPVLDMYLYSEYENNGMHLGDGLHPSQSFMREYAAPKIVEFIKEYYGTEYKHEHTEVVDKAVAPTCTETGLTEGKHCSVCGEILVKQEIVDTIAHTWLDATCVAPKTCDVCGKTEGEADPDAHAWGEWTQTKAPDYVSEGENARECSLCGEVETEVVEKLGVTWYFAGSMNNWGESTDILVYDKDGNASIEMKLNAGDEFKIADVHSHDWNVQINSSHLPEGVTHFGDKGGNIVALASGTFKFTVSLDKKLAIEVISLDKPVELYFAGSHSNGAWGDSTELLVYDENGNAHITREVVVNEEFKIAAIKNEWRPEYGFESLSDKVNFGQGGGTNIKVLVAGTYTFTITSDCKLVIEKVHVCEYTEDITTLPTCTTEGLKTFTCECGESYTEAIPVDENAHNYVGEITTKPTCESDGVKTFTCTHDASHTYTEPVDKLGHKDEDGDHWCDRCEKSLCGENHTWVEADCENPKTCSVCGTVEGEKLGHQPGEAVKENVNPATCTEDGSYDLVVYCSRCKTHVMEKTTVTVEAEGHKFGEWTVSEETDTTIEYHRECACGEEETKVSYKVTVHFKNTSNWAKVNTYMWTTTTVTAAWPGDPATKGEDGWWSYSIVLDSIEGLSLIFNNGSGQQTADLKYDPAKTYWIGSASYATQAEADENDATHKMYIKGTINNWQINKDHLMTQSEDKTKWTITLELSAGTKFKVFNEINNGWYDNNGGQDMVISEAGTYLITYYVSGNKVTVENVTPHTHVYAEEITKAPTCTEEGVKTFSCECGDSYTEAIAVNVNAHKWGVGVVTKDATCNAVGVMTYTCVHNSEHTRTEDIAIDPNAHKWGEWITDTPATEETEGTKHRECERCDAKETGTIPTLEHVHSYTAVVTAPTCTEQGYTTHTCRCGDSYVDKYVAATGHTEVIDKAVAPTCTETGLTEGKHCDVCKKVLIAQETVKANGHSFTNYVSNNDATCTEDGTKTAKCDNCDETDTVTDEGTKLGHSFTNYVSNNDATCTEDGTKTAKCDRCDETDTIADAGSKLGHDVVNHKAQNPTCTEKGWKAYETCNREGCSYTTYEEIPASGHNYDGSDWMVTGEGTKARYCTVDGCDGAENGTYDVNGTHYASNKIYLTPGPWNIDGAWYAARFWNDTGSDYWLPMTDENGDGIYECDNPGYKYVIFCRMTSNDKTTLDWKNVWNQTGDITVGSNNVYTITGWDRSNYTAESKTHVCVYNAATCEDPMTCVLCDTTKGDALGHEDADKNHKCDRCESAMGTHAAAEGSHVCEYCGETVSQCADNDNDHYCDVCDKELSQHTPASAVQENVTAPTCTADGKHDDVVYCSYCNDELERKTVTDEALGHDLAKHAAKAATCTEIGWEAYETCSRCDYTTYKEISALGHTEVVDKAVAPTCEDTGLTEGKHCSVCGEILVKQNSVDAIGHNYNTAAYRVVDGKLVLVHTCERNPAHEIHDEPVEVGTVVSITNEGDLKTVLSAGYSVALAKDIDLTSTIKLEGVEVVIDLAGHTITADWESDDVVEVLYIIGATVTINDTVGGGEMKSGANGAVNSVVSALDGATLTINGGYYYSADIGDVIFARSDAENNLITNVYINGGKFEAAEALGDKYYVLDTRDNSEKENRGIFHVTGGEFVNFDPANHTNDGDYTNKLADGYHSIKGGNVYTVSKHEYDAVVTDPNCVDKGYTTHTCYCGHSYVDSYVDALGHTKGEVVVENNVAPDCVNAGKYDNVVYCTVCKVELERKTVTVNALGHTEVTDKAVAPDCVNTGLTEGKHCSVCNTVLVAQETVEALGHTEVIDEAVAATCTETGLTEGKHCSVCEVVLVAQETVAATGHAWDEGVITTEPKCEEAGIKTFTCEVCGTTKTEVVEATGHHDADENNRCDECDASLCVEHAWVDATCTTPKTCSACNATEGKALGHEYNAVVTNPTCEADGYTTYTCIRGDHIYTNNTVEALGHTEVIDAAKAPTCTATGLTEGKHCSVCDAVLVAQTVVEKLPHTEVVDEAVAATCTETGLTEGKHCSVCNEVLVKQEKVNALGHTEVIDDAVAATCTETGLTEGKHCSVCKAVLVAQETVDALGHTEVIDDAVAATCTETGLTEGKHCSACNKVLVAQEVVPSLGHTEETLEAVAPTCTTDGKTAGKKCSVCNTVLVAQEVVPATGHSYTSQVTKAATCTETGVMTYTCSCGDTYTETIETIAHSYNAVVTAPTCTADGYTTYTCSCGDTYTGDEVAALGHKDENLDHACDNGCGTTMGEHVAAENSHNCGYCGEKMSDCTGGDPVKKNEKAATCTENGSYDNVVYCTVCEKELSRETITVITEGHDYVDGLCSVCNAFDLEDTITIYFQNNWNWTNVHLYYWNATTTLYNEPFPGTKLNVYKKDGSNREYYELVIPVGATHFIVSGTDNGNTNQTPDIGTNTVEKTKIYYMSWVNGVGNTLGSYDHEYTSIATCTTPNICLLCGPVGDPLGHTEVIDKAVVPTCTATGLTEGKHCSVCKEVLVAQTVVDALGHTEVTDKAVAPTCTATGLTEGKHCSVCNTVLVAQTVVDALGHTEVIDEAVAATCTETGLTEGKHCSVCKAVLVAQETVDALGHDWGSWTSNGDGTHSKVCGNNANHTETTNCGGGEATCKTLAECSDCGEEYGELAEHSLNARGVCIFGCGFKHIEDGWYLVTDVSQLAVGSEIVIVGKETTYALSTNQKSSNRGAASVTKSENTITFGSDVQIITLRSGTSNGTFGFYVGDGYLYAASSSGNQLKTQTTNNVNGSWTITVTDDGIASIVAKGSENRNVMQFNPNNGSPLFACYASASQTALQIYIKGFDCPPHEHTGGQANCSSLAVCEVCGEQYGEMGGHISSGSATCETAETCTICKVEIAPATGHNYSEVITAPTCTTDGYTTYTCKNDASHTYIGDEIAATGHNYVDGTCSVCGEADPTVSETITTTYTFADYPTGTQYAENEKHVLDDKTTITTTQCHFTSELRIYSSSAHNGYAIIKSTGTITGLSFNAGDNTDTLNVYGSNDGSTWILIEGVETASSYKDYTVSGDFNYSWLKLDVAGSNQVRVKSITLTVTFDVDGCLHENKKEVVTEEATCTEAGSKTVVCNDCGETVSTEVIEATGHNYVGGTCTSCGEKDPNGEDAPDTKEITFNLGANGSASHVDGNDLGTSTSYTEGYYTLALTGMSKVYGPAYDAKGNSCIKLGTSSATGYFSFTVPDDVVSVVINIAKYKANTTKISVNGTAYTLTKNSNDGQYDAITVDTSTNKTVTLTTVSGGVRAMVNSIIFTLGNAECEHDGGNATCQEQAVCAKCGESYGELGDHSFTNYVSNNDATCTADGTKTAKCDNCDATDTVIDEGSMLDHSFTNYVSNNDATCTADGTKTAQCDNCDATDTVTDEGTKLSHSFTNYVSNNDASCTEDGTKTATCDRTDCNVTNTIADEGSAKGHNYVLTDNGETYYEECTVCQNKINEKNLSFVYLDPNANWHSSNARFAVYFFNNSTNANVWVDMTDADGNGIYKAKVPYDKSYPNLIFCRMNPNGTNGWTQNTQIWNQTSDLTLSGNENKYYQVADGAWSKGSGSWNQTILFFKPNSSWKEASARFAAYFFGNGEKWISMTDRNGDGIYEVYAPANYPNVIFVRMNPSNSTNNWDNKWNQSGDLTVPTNGNNLFTAPNGTWDKFTSTWSKHKEE